MKYRVLLVLAFAWTLKLHAQCGSCTFNQSLAPTPYGFNPDTLRLPAGKDTTLTIHFTFPDTVRRGTFVVNPNYAIWVDSLRLLRGLITIRGGNNPFKYDTQNPADGGIVFNIPHTARTINGCSNQQFVIYRNPGNPSGAPAGSSPPRGCANVCIRTASDPGCDMLIIRVRAFIPGLADVDGKDTVNLEPVLLGNPAWLDTLFRYPIIIGNASCDSTQFPRLTTPAARQCPNTSFSGVSLGPALMIFPNPSYGEAQLLLDIPTASTMTIRAFASDGREVYRHTAFYQAGTHTHPLSLPAGAYVVVLEGAGGSYSQRLMMVE
ncbi:MAG: T9SS type A sorting domain-containing protein [Bacteroidia bacterium]|nr:T9SS type A sorting domain-containing protein [Bacteroidia bacterium]